MTFKGDLKDINLADIFQTLAMNQQEGTLTVTSGDRHTDIYFNKDGVRLLASPDQKHVRLGELLLKSCLLTPVELDMALARQKMTGELLGQALIDMNVVSPEDISGCVRKQIEEDIYEVFSWKRAVFEFVPGEPKGEFYDPAKMGNPIAFNVNSVIMEAARRIDEWAFIHKGVPSTATIYMIKDLQAAIPDISHLGFSGEDILQIVKAIDGRATVEDIIERSPMTKFEVCKIVAGLVETAYVGKLDLKETVHIADGLYREGDTDGAIKIYRDSLQDHPGDVHLRLKLAELYETEDMKTEAATEYAKAGQNYLDSGARQDGLTLYHKAIELAPKNFTIRHSLFGYYCSAHNYEAAAKEGLFVAKTYWRMNRLDEACSTLEQILEMTPENVEALQMLTSIHMDLEEPEKTLDCYETLADIFKRSEDKKKLVECYRKMLVLEPKRGDIRNKLNSLLSKQKKVKRDTGHKLAYILVLLLVLIGAGAAYYTFRELGVRAKLDEFVHEVDEVLAGIDSTDTSTKTEQELGALLNQLEAFKKSNSFSIKIMTDTELGKRMEKVRKRIDEITEKRTQMHQGRIDENERLYQNAQDADEKKDYIEAIKGYKMLNRELLGQGRARDVEKRLMELESYLEKAEALFNEAQRHKNAGEWLPMHEKLTMLHSKFKYSPKASKVELPLLVESEPAGAEVRIAGAVVGKTPYVHMRKPGFPLHVEVTKWGYKNPPARVMEDSDWKSTFTLAKVPIWVFKAQGLIDAAPVADGQKAYFGTRDGFVYAIDLKLGNRAWKFKPDSYLPAFVASPMIASGRIYIGSQNKFLYVLDMDKGQLLWEMKLGAVIHSAPSSIDKNGVFYIGCRDDRIYAINSVKQTQVWSYATGDQVMSDPVHRNNIVYAGSNDNMVHAIGAGTGQRVWRHKTLGPVTAKAAFYRNKGTNKELLIIGSSDKAVYALDTTPELPEGQDRVIWSFATGGAVTASACVSGEFVYVMSSDAVLYCLDAASGAVKWRFDSGESSSSSPIVVDGIVYFGSNKKRTQGDKKGTDGYFYAVSAKDGQPVWKYKTSGRIIGGACASGEYILVGDDDCKMYCFIKD